MKKIICFIITILLITGCSYVSAASETGHSYFKKVFIASESDARLLINLNLEQKNHFLSQVKRKFIGWSIYTKSKNIPVKYEAHTIFSRSNDTKNPISFEYKSKYENEVETSVNTTGSLTTKISGKIKTVGVNLDNLIRLEIGKNTTISTTEETSFKVTIYPQTRVSLIVKGDARLSNGASKYYFFGICFKKGCWEYIDVASEYYELSEENL